ncbi:MAG: hypothetical protein ACFCU8_10270 [Thermosynechococcaceae cyanobacterium]
MKIAISFRKGLQVLCAAGLFLFLSFAGQFSLTAQADTYKTKISPGNQYGENPPTVQSTIKQRESGFKVGKVVRKGDTAQQTKEIDKVQPNSGKAEGAKAK